MLQRLDQRLVGILQAGVLADDGNRHFAFGIADLVGQRLPAFEIRRRRTGDAESRQHLIVEALGMIGRRHVIDMRHVERLDHGRFADIAEQRQLAALFLGDRPVAAAKQDVGLDADRAQFLDRMLGRLGLQFARARDIGHQRQVNIDDVIARQVVADLADRLQERHRLDVADRAADLAEHEVDIVIAGEHERLDRVGDVRNHLDGPAEIVAAPLLGDDFLVDLAGRDRIGLRGRTPREALVVTEIEIRFGAIIGDEDFAMLIRAHRARIDIEIGIELPEADLVPSRLEHRSERCRGNALAEGGNHAAGDEYVPRHGL